jgi:L-seryl-tRNA(Ser) seleniumtransferase
LDAPASPPATSPGAPAAADPSPHLQERLRELPSVDRLATAVARAELADRREAILGGASDDGDLVAGARARLRPSLRRVLNATGVVIHTNLGRAPLAAEARAAVAAVAAGYANVEYDLATGERGSRNDHVEGLLRELTGAEAALVVNNCAAAALLAVAAIAGPGSEVIVSRGQLVEIGGGFRIPEVIAQAGARLVEVGTTNRTRLGDYRAGLTEDTAALLRVHPSNFRSLGFVEEVGLEELVGLGLPVIDDVGSGALAEGLERAVDPAASDGGTVTTFSRADLVADEPAVRDSVSAGAALTAFSGDKLLGGPQAGVLVGRRDAIGACRRHPLARAVRIDKLSLAALDATLRLYRDPELARRELPVLAMLTAAPEVLAARARRLAEGTGGAVVESIARVGGGALPLLELPGPAVALDPGPDGVDALAGRLRAGDPALVGRIREGRLLLDPRTLADGEIAAVADAVKAARA